MGTIIRFPLEQRMTPEHGPSERNGAVASIVILPVIRIDRHVDQPAGGVTPGGAGSAPNRGRRRRTSRT